MDEKIKKKLLINLKVLYGDNAEDTFEKLLKVINKYKLKKNKKKLNENDCILIIYGDQIRKKNEKSLKTLGRFASDYFSCFSILHILPFFISSADRGFSVVDYKKVDRKLGDWTDLRKIERNFQIMSDLVLNHVSPKHFWFQKFLKSGIYADYFIHFYKKPNKKQLEKVFRPRNLPLLTKFKTKVGNRWIWTTFGKDHIDLNYKKSAVFLEIIDNFLFYISQGTKFVRLDAIAYIWKHLGTSCIHLPEAHIIVKIFRDIADFYGVKVITETNVIHRDNISYFGNNDEAHMVYNFALPPLVLHTIYSGNATKILRWVKRLKFPSNENTFLNFLDSHDGIGVLGAEGFLNKKEIDNVVKSAKKNGAVVNYKKTKTGRKPYELASTWFSILDDKSDNKKTINRYIASRAIALSLKGIPLIYLHGLLGSKNDYAGYRKTGQSRDVNRKNFNESELKKLIADKSSVTSQIYNRVNGLLNIRSKQKEFHVNASQKVLFLNKNIFSIIRGDNLLVLINVFDKEQKVKLPRKFINKRDIIGNIKMSERVSLKPYDVLWIR